MGAFSLSRTPPSTGAASIDSTSTRCVSPRANCGATRRVRGIPSISTFGRTTLNQPDTVSLPRLPRDEGGPVFAGPCQAQAFALAVKLSQQGHFTWKEWAAELAAGLK